MNCKEIKQAIKSKFEILFDPKEFKTKISSQGVVFSKAAKIGANSVVFGITNYDPTYKIGLALSIGSSAMYNLYHHIAETDKFDPIPNTIGYSYADYKNIKNFDFIINTEEDLRKMYEEVANFMNGFGFNFFEKYTTLESIDELLNTDPTKQTLFAEDIGWRSRNGIIIAKLVSNPNLEQIITTYRDLQKRSEFYLRHYEKFVKFVNGHSREELLEIASSKTNNNN